MLRAVAAVVIAISVVGGVAFAAAPGAPPGTFQKVTLPERSPLSSIDESFRRTPRQFTGTKFQTWAEMSDRERALLDYDLGKESVDVVVPASARDGSPHGLFVWLGVTQPNADWFGALARHRLIYVTPNNCDGRSPWVKRGLAIDAVHNLSKRYNIDASRVYLSGFSAGAHASAKLVVQFPDVFRGAVCLMGGVYYRTADPKTPGKPGGPDVTVIGPAWYGDVERLKQDLRLVSVFGGGDDMCPPEQGRADDEALRLDGFQHAYIELPGHGHSHPDLATFQRALSALDAPPGRAPTTQPIDGNQRPHPDQLAQAKRLLTTARIAYEQLSRMSARPATAAGLAKLAADDPTFDASFARRCLTKLLADYPTTPAAAEGRALLAKLDALPVPAATSRPTEEAPGASPEKTVVPGRR
jgi:predicted esterase